MSDNSGFNLAVELFEDILPLRKWDITYSHSSNCFNCDTLVLSPDSREDRVKYICMTLRFKLTKQGEMYADSIIVSQKKSTGSWNGSLFAKFKQKLLTQYGKEWKDHLRSHNVLVKFNYGEELLTD